MSNASVKEVAMKSGYSVPAVYLALSGKGRLSETARQRILDSARELRFRPNAAARAMGRGRFNAIALLGSYDGHFSPISSRVLVAAQRKAATYDLQLNLAMLRDEEITSEQRMPKILSELSVDGILLNYINKVPPRMVQLVDELAMPAIWINVKRDHDCIFPDDFEGVLRGTRHLLEMGHSRIAYMSALDSDHYSVEDRRGGYIAAMQQAGHQPLLFEFGDRPQRAELYAWIRSRLSGKDAPTAVVIYEHELAQAVLWQAMVMGLDVPGDLSVLYISELSSIPGEKSPTMMRLPQYKIGREAVDLVRRKVDQPGEQLPAVRVPLDWVPGETAGPIGV